MHEKDAIPRQAVIIADSFNSRFKPITLEKPRCLLPLVNTPLIDYTLQMLINNGFSDLIIFCCVHADKIKKYISENDWISKDGRATIRTIVLEQCFSIGDAMREIDSKSIIRGPFVLVTGDIVSNMDLRAAMNKHQEFKEIDKSAIMTCVLKKVMPGHSTRGIEDDVVIAVNADSSRLLGFQNANRKKLYYELDMFADNEVIDFRYDLMNTHICLCEAHVPSRFADHFDIQDMEAFLKGTIGGEELSGETVYTYMLENDYAARVSNLRTYAAISQDVIHRWVYPIVPDNNTCRSHEDQYIYRRRGIYHPNSVTPSKAVIKQNTVIGPGTIIGRETVVTDTVIGKNCEIGDNVLINNSFIWDEVTIKDNCIIEHAVLCSGAIVKCGTTVQKGCILSFDTAVGPSVIIPPNTRVTTKPDHYRKDSQCSNDSVDSECTRCSDTDILSASDAEDVLGSEKWGIVYRGDSDGDDQDVASCYNDWYGTPEVREMDELSDSSDSTPVPTPEPDDSGFYREMYESISGGYKGKTAIDHIILEINSSKHAYNISIEELLIHGTRAVLELANTASEFNNYIKYLGPLFNNYAKTTEMHLVILNEIQTWFIEKDKVGDPYLQKILHILYSVEVLEEVAILKWHSKTTQQIKNSVQKFIGWLEEAEEESSEEESDLG